MTQPDTTPDSTVRTPPGADAARALPGEATPRWLRPALVRLVVMTVVIVAVTAVVSAANRAVIGSVELALGVGVVTSALALWAYALAVRVTERRRAVELRLTTAWSGLWRGTTVGLTLFAVTIGVIAALGGYRVVGSGSALGALTTVGLMCIIVTTEELLFRGVLFRIIEELTGTWGALVLSAAVFGVMHLRNPDATPWGAAAIAIEAGLLLGAAYVATRALWLPIGLHLGWNSAQSAIFGTAASGADLDTQSLLDATLESEPVLLTGGAVGPEASVMAIVACTVPTVILLVLAHRRGRIYRRTAARRPADGR